MTRVGPPALIIIVLAFLSAPLCALLTGGDWSPAACQQRA
jgi:hypothetical protein